MAEYQVFFIDGQNRVARPPEVFECEGEILALQKARELIGEEDIELWEGARFIVRFGGRKNFEGLPCFVHFAGPTNQRTRYPLQTE